MTTSAFRVPRPAARLRASVLATVAVAAVGAAVGPATADAARRVELRTGHIDAVSAKLVKGKLRLYVKDATAGADRVRWRDPDTVLVRVLPAARITVPANLGFIGRAGSTAWLIPQVQRDGVIWAGWNTEELSSKQLRGALTWRLRKVAGPGRVVIYQNESFGDTDVLFTSAKKLPQRQSLPLGVHVHGNWAFTRRGTYRLTFSMSGKSTSGRTLRATETLRLRVG
ncbi:choice-of-anchor M domain-containing protein [Patulibacter sp. S7RM1-6]